MKTLFLLQTGNQKYYQFANSYRKQVRPHEDSPCINVMMRRWGSEMRQYEIGMLVRSKSGHDHGKVYVILDVQAEYLYLVDGRIKTLSNPKKKKAKHVQGIDVIMTDIVTMKQNNTLIDENIKRAIKLYEAEINC